MDRKYCYVISFLSLFFSLALMQSRAGESSQHSGKQILSQSAISISDTGQFHGYQQGFNMKLWMGNMGVFGSNYSGDGGTPFGSCGLEYPESSGVEHLYGAGICVGAIIDTSVTRTGKFIKSVANSFGELGRRDFSGDSTGRDSFFITSVDNPNNYNHRFIDDDMDGKTDEDELDGIDNDNDGKIDEDYGAVSENDAYVAYCDTTPRIGHVPLGIKVWQRSFAWKNRVTEPVLPFEFYIINVGDKTLHNVYIGFFADADVGLRSVSGYFSRNSSGYFSNFRTAYVFNVVDSVHAAFGITLLQAGRLLDSVRYTFHSWDGGGPNNQFDYDSSQYNGMASGRVDVDEYPSISDTRFLVSVGPFYDLSPGDTMKFSMAMVAGELPRELENNLQDNAGRAIALYQRNYVPRQTISSPPLHVTKQQNKVILDWKWKAGDQGVDPVETWDDMDQFLNSLPQTHWRRTNPPAGHTAGGRMFQGFRVWRSDSPTFKPNTFGLLKEFNVIDDLQQGYQTGLQFTLTDSGLNPERSYWYAVTSVSIPELEEVVTPNASGGFDTTKLTLTPSLESDIAENATLVTLTNEFRLYQSYPNPFNPSTTIAYRIPEDTHVLLSVFDVLGKEVAHLVDGFRSAGRHEITWDANGFASGVYFYQIKAGSFLDVKKAVLIR
jgi:hypothetical protein